MSIKVAFIENKLPDLDAIGLLLERCAKENQWANEGPLFRETAAAYHDHLNLGDDLAVYPCSNGGVALELLARVQSLRAGRRLKWVASAFSFGNLGRGYFADIQFVDCDVSGRLDLSALSCLDPTSFDGLIVTNPHGLLHDFSEYVDFAVSAGKALLIDNAAGLRPDFHGCPWQSISLHQTKPYGVGEGGLALVPRDALDDLRQLAVYGPAPKEPRAWLNNGKVSDIACAFHLDRLSRQAAWRPSYLEQAERVLEFAKALEFRPLMQTQAPAVASSLPFLAPKPVSLERVRRTRRLSLGKFYKPLTNDPTVSSIYRDLVNLPAHPDVALLRDDELHEELERLLE